MAKIVVPPGKEDAWITQVYDCLICRTSLMIVIPEGVETEQITGFFEAQRESLQKRLTDLQEMPPDSSPGNLEYFVLDLNDTEDVTTFNSIVREYACGYTSDDIPVEEAHPYRILVLVNPMQYRGNTDVSTPLSVAAHQTGVAFAMTARQYKETLEQDKMYGYLKNALGAYVDGTISFLKVEK
ncbi:MAG: hypothetical protein ABIG95_04880 [Candidatus Woesearchaeota archaeon]